MAELALAIIPIGLRVCSGLVSYLGALKDRNDALDRLRRQAESLEGCFQLLDASLKQGHLDPTRYQAVSHIMICLKNCEEGLKELGEFEQTQKSQNRLEHSLQKILFPLRKAHLDELQNMLDRLCQPLSLAIQNLQLEMDLANSSALSQNITKVQQATDAVSDVHTAVGDLAIPINTIQSRLPLLQDSVDGFIPQIIPQINLAIESRLQAHLEEIRQSLQHTELAAIGRHNATKELLSQLTTPNSGRVAVVARLASRPSTVAELGSYISTCSCRPRRSSTTRSLRFASIYMNHNIVTRVPHEEECPFFVANLKSSRRRTLSLTGIIKLLNCAIQLSFCTTTGAGGLAISPSLTYFGVVEEKRAPAFQVLALLWSCAEYGLPRAYQELCLQAVLRKLQEIFRLGRARPTDVKENGSSLLHMMAYAMYYWHNIKSIRELKSSPGFDALFEFLIDIGTPVGLTDSTGLLALQLLDSNLATSASVLGKLCCDDVEVHKPSRPSRPIGCDHSLEKLTEVDRENKSIIEALYGPLTRAIIRRDEARIKELVDNSPECLGETTSYGATPLYLAVERPEILKLIVNRASTAQLTKTASVQLGDITPLGRAMMISGLICSSQDSTDGSNCPCVAAAKILLSADCPIIPDRDFLPERDFALGFWDDENLFASASKHCKALVSQSIRNRRRDLKELARKRLLKSEFSPFDTSIGELDFYAVEVYRLLYRKRLTSFDRLATVEKDAITYRATEKPIYEPVYLSLTCPEDASTFLNLGFCDLDTSWESIPINVGHLDIAKRFMTSISPRYAIWLQTHVPRFWEWISQYSDLEGFNFILADIAGRYMHRHRFLDLVGRLEGVLSTIRILDNEDTDNCSCLCAPGGCKPFDIIARWLAFAWKSYYLLIGDAFRLFVEHNWKVLEPDQLNCLVRQATFEALGMTHTCLDKPRYDPFQRRWQASKRTQEAEEASRDDHEKAEYLDDLVAEFEDFMLGPSEGLEYQSSGGSATPSVHSGDECPVELGRALVFWDEIWPERVGEIKKVLESTWDPDPEILNDLGVSLWYEEEEISSETLEEECVRKLDDFINKLDSV